MTRQGLRHFTKRVPECPGTAYQQPHIRADRYENSAERQISTGHGSVAGENAHGLASPSDFANGSRDEEECHVLQKILGKLWKQLKPA